MKNSLKCVIIDDEPKAIGLLEELLTTLYKEIDIIHTFTSWDEALPVLRVGNFDILFQDMSMPGKSGLDLLNLLKDIKFEVIFVTAYSEYALKAFDFFPSGYILKPIDDKQISFAVNKAIERATNKRLSTKEKPNLNADKIGIPNNKGIDYYSVSDIVSLESDNSCTKVTTKTARLVSSYNLSRFKSILENYPFYQVHRSFLVNLNEIKRYLVSGAVIMNNGDEIPVARSQRDELLSLFHKIAREGEE